MDATEALHQPTFEAEIMRQEDKRLEEFPLGTNPAGTDTCRGPSGEIG